MSVTNMSLLEPRTSLLFCTHCHQTFAQSSDDLLIDPPIRALIRGSNLRQSSQLTAIRS
jgi:hypothetical protein